MIFNKFFRHFSFKYKALFKKVVFYFNKKIHLLMFFKNQSILILISKDKSMIRTLVYEKELEGN